MSVDQLQVVLGLIAIATALAGLWRWLRPKYRATKTRANAAIDSLVGRDAIVDSITGREIAPALPGIGQRMETVEHTLAQLVDQRARIDDHEHRLTTLESAAIERVVTRAESLQHLTTLDEAMRRQPEEDEPA